MLVGFASTVFADKITISGHGDYRQGVGGEFNVRAADGDAGGVALLQALSTGYFVDGTNVAGGADGTLMKANANPLTLFGFQTFCLEYNEYITLNGTYNAQIGLAAVNGGVGIGAGPVSPRSDPISLGTAYLYTLFATGNLDEYEYSNGATRRTDAELLQKTFWYLENERTLGEIGGSNKFLQVVLDEFINENAARVDNNDFYNVRVLNISSVAGSQVVQNQSQLIMVPDDGITAIMLGFGLSGLGLLRRKPH